MTDRRRQKGDRFELYITAVVTLAVIEADDLDSELAKCSMKSTGYLGWLMGLEPTTTGITILCIDLYLARDTGRSVVTDATYLSTILRGFAEVGYRDYAGAIPKFKE